MSGSDMLMMGAVNAIWLIVLVALPIGIGYIIHRVRHG